jgi:hypothetical protein
LVVVVADGSHQITPRFYRQKFFFIFFSCSSQVAEFV